MTPVDGSAAGATGAPDGSKVVRFYYDFSSPWSYLGATQIERVAAEAGGTVEWKPMLLGAVFKTIGSPLVPIFTQSQARQRYQGRDFQHWADHWGVPFRWPSRFPMNSVLALRAVCAADEKDRARLSLAVFHAYWADDLDIADKVTLGEVLGAVDSAGLVERAEEPAVKALLRANTDGAVAAGVFGAPTFFVGDQMIFGQDRFDFVRAALEGKRL